MPRSTTRIVGPAADTIAAAALKSLQAINHRLTDGGILFQMAEVKGPVKDRLKSPHFLAVLTGKVHLTQCDTVSGRKPGLARRTIEAQ